MWVSHRIDSTGPKRMHPCGLACAGQVARLEAGPRTMDAAAGALLVHVDPACLRGGQGHRRGLEHVRDDTGLLSIQGTRERGRCCVCGLPFQTHGLRFLASLVFLDDDLHCTVRRITPR